MTTENVSRFAKCTLGGGKKKSSRLTITILDDDLKTLVKKRIICTVGPEKRQSPVTCLKALLINRTESKK